MVPSAKRLPGKLVYGFLNRHAVDDKKYNAIAEGEGQGRYGKPGFHIYTDVFPYVAEPVLQYASKDESAKKDGDEKKNKASEEQFDQRIGREAK